MTPLAETAASVARDLSRRLYVMSGIGRAAAFRVAYAAYGRTLSDRFAAQRRNIARPLRERMERLYEQDWNDAEEGIYPRALIETGVLRDYAKAVPKMLRDLPKARARAMEKKFDDLPAGAHERYPRYYARNFHFQTDGYLGHTSADIYDLQVEFLFGGTAAAMRRRLVPPVVREARAQAARGETAPFRVLDVACGTGKLLAQVGAALPQAQLTGLDLSPHYIAHARGSLSRDLELSLLVENAETMPFADARFDAVTCLYLFHELPADVRDRVLEQIARVVKPGGLVVLGDSVQLHDTPEFDQELLAFPVNYHEPYYLSYVKEDLADRVRRAGLVVESVQSHFLTKVLVARRPKTPAYAS